MENYSFYLALVEPTSSHTLPPNDNQARKYGKSDIDTKYPGVNDNNVKSGDIANTLATIKFDGETDNSVSVDNKDITKLGDIVSRFTSSQPQAQEYFSPEGTA
jgi:hypothetical protein